MSLSPTIIASLITGASTVTATVGAVVLTAKLQTRRIDADNKTRLEAQTGELKQHLKGEGP